MNRIITILLSSAILLFSCCNRLESGYTDAWMWGSADKDCHYSADVFYISSTDILESFDEDGSESPLAVLNDGEKTALSKEIDFIHSELFPDSVNFFAPYYHQVTLKALLSSDDEKRADLLCRAGMDVCDAFDYFMANMNDGRPFVLAGFSQGAILVKQLLNHMTDEQYERMVAAYMIGWGLNAEALASPHIVPASGAYDTGVTISYNSVRNPDALWGLVHNNACTCINPVNWSTDATPACFEYDGDTLTASVDTIRHLIIIDGYDPAKYEQQDWVNAPWPKGNYHHFEIQFYNSSIRRNVLDRIRHMRCKTQKIN